ncbi:unnamed protein product [Gongylonema pulchrum]|uniref:Myosin_tail_1 domain-containing protein n=1 Tax=Gongylonema pulchrum TaxID=637853 RepID=A0A183E7S1_9BILA|nr:unnamed protein product [Gongylonema pulchrum]
MLLWGPIFHCSEKETVNDICYEELKRQKEDAERQLVDERARTVVLQNATEQLEWSLGEFKQWLSDARARIGDLERMLDEEKCRSHLLANLNEVLDTKPDQIPLGQQAALEVKALPELNEELRTKQREIDDLITRAKDAEWSLGEHKQWLTDANNRANHLDQLCHEKDLAIEDLTNKLRDAEHQLLEIHAPDNIDELNSTIANLRNELTGAEKTVQELDKAKKDAEWFLGEHKDWLQNANNRIKDLEEACIQKDAIHNDTVRTLNEKIAELQRR